MTEKTASVIKGGSFLIEDVELDRVFTPEDFSEEQIMIAKTAEDFVIGEVVPVIENLENHEFEHSVRLLKAAGDLGLLAADVPEEYEGLAAAILVLCLWTAFKCKKEYMANHPELQQTEQTQEAE